MDEFAERAKNYLDKRVKQVREEHGNLSRAEKKAQMEEMDRILYTLTDGDREWLDRHITNDMVLTENECEALYLAGLKDGLQLLKLISI